MVAVTGRDMDEKAVEFLQFSQCGLNLVKFELIKHKYFCPIPSSNSVNILHGMANLYDHLKQIITLYGSIITPSSREKKDIWMSWESNPGLLHHKHACYP